MENVFEFVESCLNLLLYLKNLANIINITLENCQKRKLRNFNERQKLNCN